MPEERRITLGDTPPFISLEDQGRVSWFRFGGIKSTYYKRVTTSNRKKGGRE